MSKETTQKAMETNAQKTAHVFNQDEPKMYRRVRALGMNVLRFDKKTPGDTKALEVKAFGLFTKKDGDVLEYVDVTDLDSGEEGRIWLDGSLKHNLNEFSKTLGLPFKVEIMFAGTDTAMVEINGKMTETEINTYKFWEIQTN